MFLMTNFGLPDIHGTTFVSDDKFGPQDIHGTTFVSADKFGPQDIHGTMYGSNDKIWSTKYPRNNVFVDKS